jgi:hypothetical protein
VHTSGRALHICLPCHHIRLSVEACLSLVSMWEREGMRSLDSMRAAPGMGGRVAKVQLHSVKAFQRVVVIHRSGSLGKYFEMARSSLELVALVRRTVDLDARLAL